MINVELKVKKEYSVILIRICKYETKPLIPDHFTFLSKW